MTRQRHLFGEPPPKPEPGVGPCEVPEDLRRVACALPEQVRLGTSSWSFPGWEGLVWDRAASKRTLARSGLAAYARHPLLRSVGIDRTFYAPIAAEEFAGYADAVPDDFRFLVKAAAACTTPRLREAGSRSGPPNPRFLDPGWATDEVVGPFREGLGGKAGPLVFQFPPVGPDVTGRPEQFADALGAFLMRLPKGPNFAVELRDPELLVPDYFAALREAGAVHCFGVHPRMPTIRQQRRLAGESSGPLVVRWMLHSGLKYEQALERYEPFSELVDEDPETREELVDLSIEPVLRGQPIVIVANNKAEGSAPRSVFKLARALAERSRGSGRASGPTRAGD